MLDKREKKIGLYLSQNELANLQELADDRGMDKQQLLRWLLNSSYKDLIERRKYI